MAIAFGYVDLVHVFKRRIGEMDNGVQVVREATARTVAFHNQEADTFTAKLADPVDQAKIRYEMPGGGTLQPLDEDGNPLPTIGYEGYDVAFPIRGGGDAYGTNRLSRAMMTVEDANNAAQEARVKDKNFLVDHMLAAVLTKESYPYLDKSRQGYTGNGEVTVMPLANNDATRYLINRGRGISGAHQHYTAQVAGIDAANNPYPGLFKNLREHTDNGEATVDVYIADNLVAATQNLPNFVEVGDADITQGSGAATLNARADKGIGDEVLGKVDRCWIISMSRLPDGYMVAHLRDQKPLGMRQYPVSSLQGLFTEEFNVDSNHYETRFLRFAGFGVKNRTAAAVHQVGAPSTTYVTPAEYAAPISH